MTLVETGRLVDTSQISGGAVMAFNVITLEHAEAVTAAAERCNVPAILQVSQNAVKYHGAVEPIAAACRCIAEGADVPIALHLDHVEDPELLRRGVDAGFSSVMFDGGALPYDENVRRTRDAARWAHERGVWIEAELGYVGGKPDAPASAHAPGVRTDPDEARVFVEQTEVDALAVAVGSSHAMTTRTAALDLGLIERLRSAVEVPLVLHGSSGVPDEQLVAAIRAGMVKINIGTALNVAFTQGVQHEWESLGAPVDPRRYLTRGRERVTDVVERLLQLGATPAERRCPVR